MICTVMPLKLRPMVVAVTRSRIACIPSKFTARVTVSTCLGTPYSGLFTIFRTRAEIAGSILRTFAKSSIVESGLSTTSRTR